MLDRPAESALRDRLYTEGTERSTAAPAALAKEERVASDRRERALLTRIACGDDVALKELYLLYHRRLARFLMRITTRYDLAEEIINDTFWVVWRHAGEFRGASRVSTWILGIAYRRGLKTLQRSAPPPELGLEDTSCEPCGQLELDEWLDAALDRLPPEQRMVIELTYHMGHSCEEISTIMQCPVNTVKTRMFHARRKLKGLLVTLAGTSHSGGSGDKRLHYPE